VITPKKEASCKGEYELQKSPYKLDKREIFACQMRLGRLRAPGWRRPIGCLKLHVISRKRATNYRVLWREMSLGQLRATGWRRPTGYLKLQVISCKRATNCRALLHKTIYKDEAFYESSPPFTSQCSWQIKLQVIFRKRAINYKALLWKKTYTNKASYESWPPCTSQFSWQIKIMWETREIARKEVTTACMTNQSA